MTDEKHHVDLSKIEPVFRGNDPEDDVARDATGTGAPANPAVGTFAETDDKPPPDPDDLDRLRRG
jgi:hypothetical protein